jgi:di/tricarboxylate transporter
MFVGSMTLAYAMEHVHLHRRLALLVLRYVGSSVTWYVEVFFFSISNESFDFVNRSMGGLMVVTAFLSMWINNSASANIMIPTAIGIVSELQNYQNSTERTAMTNGDGNYPNSPGITLTDFSSYDASLNLNILFSFTDVVDEKTCLDKQSIEEPSVLNNIVVTSSVLTME